MANRVLIVTPLVPPAPGGGGIYTLLLADGLVQGGHADLVAILTESDPGQPGLSLKQGGKVEIWRAYPYRAGASRKSAGSYVKYALQQLQFLGLPRLIERVGFDVVLFHASFFYHPGIAARVVRRAIPRSKANFLTFSSLDLA